MQLNHNFGKNIETEMDKKEGELSGEELTFGKPV
jgi:hypothetical protein